MLARVPAPACTMTACSRLAVSFLIVSGVAATRVSPGRISFGIPMRIRCLSSQDGQLVSISCGFIHEPRHGDIGYLHALRSSWFVFGYRAVSLVRSARERIAALDRAAVEATAQPADAVG